MKRLGGGKEGGPRQSSLRENQVGKAISQERFKFGSVGLSVTSSLVFYVLGIGR